MCRMYVGTWILYKLDQHEQLMRKGELLVLGLLHKLLINVVRALGLTTSIPKLMVIVYGFLGGESQLQLMKARLIGSVSFRWQDE